MLLLWASSAAWSLLRCCCACRGAQRKRQVQAALLSEPQCCRESSTVALLTLQAPPSLCPLCIQLHSLTHTSLPTCGTERKLRAAAAVQSPRLLPLIPVAQSANCVRAAALQSPRLLPLLPVAQSANCMQMYAAAALQCPHLLHPVLIVCMVYLLALEPLLQVIFQADVVGEVLQHI